MHHYAGNSNVTHDKTKSVLEPTLLLRSLFSDYRYAYVNPHHTLTDWYNAFLIMNFFNLPREKTNILIVDGHPWGNLDYVWNDLFNSTLRLGHLTKPVIFKSLVFSWQGYNSPIDPNKEHMYTEMPLFEEFREFLLDTYRLPVKKILDCSSLTVTLIWRRDNYVVHPRNPSGMCVLLITLK